MKNNDFCIPVLTYHHVNPVGEFINVTPAAFDAQARVLRDQGCTTLHTADFRAIVQGETSPPRKPVMLTFDDGWLDNWVFAFPVLKRYGLKAVFFVVTSWIAGGGRRDTTEEGGTAVPDHQGCEALMKEGRSGDVMLSWEELAEMQASGLIDIQSHTHTHRRLDRLIGDRAERLAELGRELKKSREIIEGRTGVPCRAVCWPQGRFDDGYVETAHAAGYDLLFTTKKGTNTKAGDAASIRRIMIGNIGPFVFRKKLAIHSRGWLSRAYLRFTG